MIVRRTGQPFRARQPSGQPFRVMNKHGQTLAANPGSLAGVTQADQRDFVLGAAAI